MKISNISQVYKAYEAKPVTPGKKAAGSEKKDKVNVSTRAKEFQIALKAAMSSPSVREDKVNDIKNKINNNSYNVSSEDIADKIISYI